jgi:thiosulfate/3-mercaptopyruvate sulfurtransferase
MFQMKKMSTVALVFLLVVLTLSGCAQQTAYENGTHVAEAAELKVAINDPDVIVIDARDAEKYAKGHLKGAIFLSPSELTVSKPVKAMAAPKATFERVLGSRGISESSKVYIYDDNNGVSAGRIWWTMKLYGHDQVKVINNGEKAIVKAGLELSQEEPKLNKVKYTAKPMDENLVASLAEVKAISDAEESNVVLLDVRSKGEFAEGMIPGSKLYAHTENLYSDGSFKSQRTIELNYNDLGLEKDDEIVLYCKSSYRATQTAVLLKEAGYTNVKVYDGAWLEWESQGLSSGGQSKPVMPVEQDAS